MSKTAAIYPIITALLKAEEMIGPQREWRTTNPIQTLFLDEFFLPCRKESLSLPEIESIASFHADEINRFLRERGFTIQLDPFQHRAGSREFGVASVLDLLVHWLKPGTETTLKGQDGQTYPAARLSGEGCSFYQATQHTYPIAQLKTTSNDQVCLTRFDGSLANFELLHYTHQLIGSLKPILDYGGVLFPMVELKQEENISWLRDLTTTSADDQPVTITQALQETHLAMNQEGAHAQSATATAMMVRTAYRQPKPDLLIDGPFLIWFQRPGLTKPLFVGYITEEDWKNPGKLA